MGLISKEVEVVISGSNAKYYEEKWYIIPKWTDNQGRKNKIKQGTKIIIKIEDISQKSHANVIVQCNACETILPQVRWIDYLKCVKEDGCYYCAKCAANGNKKWISFYDWCYENLPKNEVNKIMERWDYELNIDKNGNKLTPSDVTCSSHGFNNKGYWFKCLDHPEHESELCDIHCFVGGQKGSIKCSQCNTIAITHPHLIEYLVNKEDAYKHSLGSSKSILMKCPICGHERKYLIPTLIKNGFACQKCSDGISYPEKFMFNVLEQLLNNNNFQTQLSKTTFKWCKNYKYDFYIDNPNIIIETHGLQHYEDRITGSWARSKTLQENQENDKLKEQLAKENGIENYIIIDCRESNMEWIKNNILKSDLLELLGVKEEDIDWLKCHEFACNSFVKVVCDLWNSGINNVSKIINKINMSRNTIIRYLKQGAELGWCDYDPKEEYNNKNKRKIICLTTKEIFNCIVDASNKYNIHASNISYCCRHITQSIDKLQNNTKLVWMYYDEYLKIKNIIPESEEI